MRRLSGVLSALFSFETLFILFLFAGRYKGDPRFAGVPVDLTALFFAMSVVVGLYVMARTRMSGLSNSWRLLAVYWLFVLFAAVSILWTPSRGYGAEKVAYLSTLVFWPLAAGALVVAPDRARLVRLGALTVVISLWFAVESLIVYTSGDTEAMINALGGNYLGLGRAMSLGLVAALALLLFAPAKPALKTLYGVVLLLFAWTLLILGGRGPLIAAGVSAMVPLAFGFRRTDTGLSVKRYVAPLTIFLLGSGFWIRHMLETDELTSTLERMMLLFNADMGASAGTRLAYWKSALDIFFSRPAFGAGIGGFASLAGFGDSRAYPHNILLEVASELGVVGVALLVTIVVLAFRKVHVSLASAGDNVRVALIMVLVNTLANAMLSGDISDNRMVFLALGLMCQGWVVRERA